MNGCEPLLNTLGMARRAGRLVIGQDHVFAECKKCDLLVILANDCSSSVLRDVNAAVGRGSVKTITLDNVDRSELGRRIGVNTAQIVALQSNDGFARKVLSLQDRSDADE
ncbi:MAG: hypothetical protein Q4F74_01700 [Synergistaceae bacterium]|nr:hypothetical protein [Synergistaceae bacterium]